MPARRILVMLATVGALLWSCSEDDTSTGPDGIPPFDDTVSPNGLVWAIGTMGGLKAIDMQDTVVRAIDLQYELFERCVAYGRYVYLLGGMTNPVKRIVLLSDSTDTADIPSNLSAVPSGRPVGGVAAMGKVWFVVSGSNAVYCIDTTDNALSAAATVGADSSECIAMALGETSLYVLTRMPLQLHAVDMETGSFKASLPVDAAGAYGGTAAVSLGFTGDAVYVFNDESRTCAVVDPCLSSVVGSWALTDSSMGTQHICAGTAGLFVNYAGDSVHSLARLAPTTGAIEASHDLTPTLESLEEVRVIGQRLLFSLIDSRTGQNAVVELDPADLSLIGRVNHVYVTDFSVDTER